MQTIRAASAFACIVHSLLAAATGCSSSNQDVLGGEGDTQDASANLDRSPTLLLDARLATVDLSAAEGNGAADGSVDIDIKADASAGHDAPSGAFRITSPAPGAVIMGSALAIVDVGSAKIDQVAFFIDAETTPVCVDSAPAYRCVVDLSRFPKSSKHTIAARGRLGMSEIAEHSVTLETGTYESDLCPPPVGLGGCISGKASSGATSGFGYIIYENRDDGHASMPITQYAGIVRVQNRNGVNPLLPEYSDSTKVVISNASLCYPVGAECPGAVRYLMRSMAGLYANHYRDNKFSWFPEHHDHDAVDKGWYMVPFANSSQGSSGSEIDELHNWVLSMGALSKATRDILVKERLLMTSMQMLFRRARVATDTEYLSGAAHANAFDNVSNQLAMVRMANNLRADSIPPLVTLEVISDDFVGKSSTGRLERALTTPTSIARVWETPGDTPRRIVVRATVKDVNNRPTALRWAIVRGAPAYVKVTPMDADETTVEITFGRHPEETISIPNPTRPIRTNLAAVAVFAHNGAYWSPPAFVTSYTGTRSF